MGFWAVMPKRPDAKRNKALKEFEKALSRGADPDAIIAGTKAYAKARAGQDPQFTQAAHNWIRDGAWADIVMPSAAKPKTQNPDLISAVASPPRTGSSG